MSLDIHFFSHPKEVCAYITKCQAESTAVVSDISVIVPTESLKDRMLHTLDLIDVSIFQLSDYVRHIILSADKIPYYQSPVFDMLIRDIMEELSKRGDVFISELCDTLNQYEQGYEGLYTAIEALLSAGVDQELSQVILEVLEEELLPEPDYKDMLYGKAVVQITQLLYLVLQRGMGVIGKKHSDDLNIGIKEASFLQAVDLLEKGKYTPEKHIILYGFADFTGIQLKFLEALVGTTQRVDLLLFNVYDLAIVDEVVFDASHDIINTLLLEKILSYTVIHKNQGTHVLPQLSFSRALGYQSELRDVFHKIRQLLRDGVDPNEIIVLAPDWEYYKPFLREESRRANIPISMTSPLLFSTSQTKKMENLIQLFLHPSTYPLAKILSLFSFDILQKEYEENLEKKKRGSQNCFVGDDILQADLVLLEDMQLYFQAFGLVDLEDLDEKQSVLERSWKEKENGYTSIPALVHMQAGNKKGVDVYQANRRKLPIAFLQHINERCLSLYALLKKQSEEKKNTVHVFIDTAKAICQELGWSKRGKETIKIYETLDFIQHVHESYPLKNYREIISLFSKKMSAFGLVQLGENPQHQVSILCADILSSGGFFAEHIFFLGLNKGIFPSVAATDPFLSERVRQKLLHFLPALRHKSAAYLEERHRLYSLIASCTNAHISWVVSNEKGKACTVSPLVRRLLLAYPEEKVQLARALYERVLPDEPIPLYDRVLLAGIHGEEETYHDAFLLYAQRDWKSLYSEYTESQREERITKAALGRFQGAEELYPPILSESNGRIGPLGGLTGLGPLSGALPENPFEDLQPIPTQLQLDHSNYITRVEQYFSCPWRNFLARLLRVEHTPDPQKTLPQLQAGILGNIVHNSLEDLVREVQPASILDTQELEDRFPPKPFSVVWDPHKMEGYLYKHSQEQMFLDQQLWMRARDVAFTMAQPYLSIEKELEFSHPIQCLGAELEGDAFVFANAEGGEIGDGTMNRFDIWSSSSTAIGIRVLFKADRVDVNIDNGELYLLDYKTGQVPAQKRSKEEKRAVILSEMKKGKKLQPAAYVASYLALKQKWPLLSQAKGTLLYLKPDQKMDLDMRDFSIESDDEEAISVFSNIIWSAAVGQALGINFPRLIRKKSARATYTTNDWCKHCDFQRACRFHDSGFRRRLEQACSTKEQEEVFAEEANSNLKTRIQRWHAFLIHSIWKKGDLQ